MLWVSFYPLCHGGEKHAVVWIGSDRDGVFSYGFNLLTILLVMKVYT